MKTKPKVATAMAVFLMLLTAPARAADFWSPAAPVKLEKIEKLVATLAEKWKIDRIERAAYGREDKEKPVPPPND